MTQNLASDLDKMFENIGEFSLHMVHSRHQKICNISSTFPVPI